MINSQWEKLRQAAIDYKKENISISDLENEKEIFFSHPEAFNKFNEILKNQEISDVDWVLFIIKNIEFDKNSLDFFGSKILKVAIDGSTRVMGLAGEILEEKYSGNPSIKEELSHLLNDNKKSTDDFLFWQLARTSQRLGFLDILKDLIDFCKNHENSEIRDFADDFLNTKSS